MAGLVDPTVTGNYPIILGDGLLGKPSNDIFTGIRYNHKPEHSSSNAPEQARLKPAVAGKTTSYDLSYNDNGTYAFAGTRNIDSKQYVLHFDPKRKAFILDRVDSTFNMNITRTPTNTDPESLRQRHPHIKDEDLKPQSKPSAATAPATAPAPKPKAKAKAKATGNVFQPAKASRKNEKKQVKKDVELALPKPQASPPPEPKKRKPRKDEDDEDEEEEEGPDPLEVDWGSPKDNNKANFSPAFTAVAPRRFDDYMNQRESEAEEADDDSEGPLDEELKLPSPVNSRTTGRQTERYPDSMDVDQKAQREDEDDDMDDLEKDLENAFEDLENSQNGSPDPGDESEISEED